MVTFVVTEPGPLHAAANEAAPVIDFVERDLRVTEISPAEAGDPSAADKPDWIAVQLPTGEKGFLHRAAVKPLEAAPEEIDQDVFFTQLRFEVASPFGIADHHYLFALAAAESGIKNRPASPGSDAIGPFKYSTDRWAELVAEYGAPPPPITTTDRSDLAKQIEMAAREAHGDADKIQELLGRTAQYNELYVVHALGLEGGKAVLALSKDHPETPVGQTLQQGGLSADEAAKLVQARPQLVKGSVADVLDAAADALTTGFDRASELALRLDPPEMQASPQASSIVPNDVGATGRSGFFPPDVIAAAQASHAKWKIPASVTLAQWAWESGWGRHMPAGSNNPFGIKAVKGQPQVEASTREVVQGRSVTVSQPFRKFASLNEAFDQHGQLLATGKPYEHARTLVNDPDAFADALTGVYATDPSYGSHLKNLMHKYNLHQYD